VLLQSVSDEALKTELMDFLAKNPIHASLITRLIQNLTHGTKRPNESSNDVVKKAKHNYSTESLSEDVKFTMHEISFALPLRKKMDLKMGPRLLQISIGSSTESVQAMHDVETILCVPTPDKPKNWTFAVFSKTGEPFLFSFDESTSKVTSNGSVMKPLDSKALLFSELKKFGQQVIEPSGASFTTSRLLTSMSEYNAKSRHVRSWIACNIGVKDAFVYLLPKGVFVGFKKPLQWYPFSQMESLKIYKATSRSIDLEISMKDSKKDLTLNMISVDEHDGKLKF
jgi:hypothetical protein